MSAQHISLLSWASVVSHSSSHLDSTPLTRSCRLCRVLTVYRWCNNSFTSICGSRLSLTLRTGVKLLHWFKQLVKQTPLAEEQLFTRKLVNWFESITFVWLEDLSGPWTSNIPKILRYSIQRWNPLILLHPSLSYTEKHTVYREFVFAWGAKKRLCLLGRLGRNLCSKFLSTKEHYGA